MELPKYDGRKLFSFRGCGRKTLNVFAKGNYYINRGNGTGASLDPIIDIEMFEAPIALQSSYIKLPNRHCGKLEQPSRPL